MPGFIRTLRLVILLIPASSAVGLYIVIRDGYPLSDRVYVGALLGIGVGMALCVAAPAGKVFGTARGRIGLLLMVVSAVVAFAVN